MGSSDRLFNRERTVHQILGGGLVADVMLWKRKDITMRILVVTFAVWLVFKKSGYTLLSFVSSVLLLLVSVLFLWAKSAAILNRPAPPLPDLYLPEDLISEMAESFRVHVNAIFSVSKDIAMGKDSKLFLKVAAHLLLISVVGCMTDILTLSCTGLILALTIPALYEKHEDCVDKCTLDGCKKLQQLYVRFDVECLGRVRNWILEKQKLS